MQGPEIPLVPGQNSVDQFHAVLPETADRLPINSPVPHRMLKNFKRGTINIETTEGAPIKITWSEETQQFDTAAISLKRKLNEYEDIDRAGRRADFFPLDQQQPSQFRQDLLSSAHPSSQDTTMLTLAHSEQLESFAVVIDPARRTRMQHQPMLVYGFEDPRATMKTTLRNRLGFQNLRTMNEYNARIGIGFSFKFQGYRKFLNEEFQFQSPYQQQGNLSTQDVDSWKEFLSSHRKTFDFSGKLTTTKERMQFLIKNYASPAEAVRLKNPELRNALLQKDWGFAVGELDPVFNLLNQMDSLSSHEANARYAALSQDRRMILDKMITYAFLRKTSKLGLEFAQNQNIPVIFAWEVPGEDINNLNRLHQLLEVKPYKFFPMESRINSQGVDSPEAITFSEMRHLGRMRQKMQVPIYFLVSKIEVIQQRPQRSSSLTTSRLPRPSLPAQAAAPTTQAAGTTTTTPSTGPLSPPANDEGWNLVTDKNRKKK